MKGKLHDYGTVHQTDILQSYTHARLHIIQLKKGSGKCLSKKVSTGVYWTTDSSVSLYQKLPVRFGTFVQHLNVVTPLYLIVTVKFCISLVLSSHAFKI
jgi:hypothetical protein